MSLFKLQVELLSVLSSSLTNSTSAVASLPPMRYIPSSVAQLEWPLLTMFIVTTITIYLPPLHHLGWVRLWLCLHPPCLSWTQLVCSLSAPPPHTVSPSMVWPTRPWAADQSQPSIVWANHSRVLSRPITAEYCLDQSQLTSGSGCTAHSRLLLAAGEMSSTWRLSPPYPPVTSSAG